MSSVNPNREVSQAPEGLQSENPFARPEITRTWTGEAEKGVLPAQVYCAKCRMYHEAPVCAGGPHMDAANVFFSLVVAVFLLAQGFFVYLPLVVNQPSPVVGSGPSVPSPTVTLERPWVDETPTATVAPPMPTAMGTPTPEHVR